MILRAIYMADLLDSSQRFEVRDCDCCQVASKEWFQNADLGRGVIDIWKTQQDHVFDPEMETGNKRIVKTNLG